MSEERLRAILDATQQCLARHGVRKTTVEDIARAAGMSRPAVYQYVRGKDEAFRRLAVSFFDDALVQAQAEAGLDGTLAQRLDRILAVKLGLLLRLRRDGPNASELLAAYPDLDRAFLRGMTDLLAATIVDAAGHAELPLGEEHAREFAELALALTRGLEGDADPERSRERLRNGTALLVAGLAASVRPRVEAGSTIG